MNHYARGKKNPHIMYRVSGEKLNRGFPDKRGVNS
jgi:hypothetical protein